MKIVRSLVSAEAMDTKEPRSIMATPGLSGCAGTLYLKMNRQPLKPQSWALKILREFAVHKL